jgi:hypothetical protein
LLYLNNINLNQNELQNAVIQVLAASPTTGKLGQIYYNSTDNYLYQYNGSAWVAVGVGYTLPTMSSTTKGGAILGTGLSVSGDTLSLGTPSTLSPSTTNSVSGTTHTHTLSGVQATITGGASTITTSNLSTNLALISNSSGKVATSTVTSTELGYLSGTTSNIQSQINNIPKYNYLSGLSTSTTLSPTSATQTQIDAVVIPVIQAAYASPSKWDAVVVALTFTPSDEVKDLMYYYNGSAWTFLYYTTTGVQLANGTTAGLIQEAASGTDISLSEGVGTVNQSTKLRNARTIAISGGATGTATSFDGSANITIPVTSLDATTLSGTASISTTGNASTATTLQTARTIGLSGVTATAQSFNGSANITIPVSAVPASLITGALGVAHGGTGVTTLTNGQALIGNGTNAVSTRAIDSTSGGTSGSTSLITSGAVYSGIQSVISQIPLAVTKTIETFANTLTTDTYTVTGYIINVMIVDSVTKEQVLADISYPDITTSINDKVTITTSVTPTNALYVIITSIATS